MSDLAVYEFRLAVISTLGANAWVVLEYLHRKDRYYRSKGQKSFYHSRNALAEATGLTPDKVRTAMGKLIGAGMVTKQPNKGVCGSNVWQVVEFPTTQKKDFARAQNPQPVGEESPASWGKIPSHKALEKSNRKSMHREMPACSSFEKECPELVELVEAIRPLEESEHNTRSLAQDAKQRGVTPGELRDLVAEVLKKPRRNRGGLLRRMLQAGDVERLRAEKTARHEADVRRRIEESLQQNIDFARDATHRSPNRELGFIWVDDSTNTCYIGRNTAYGFDLGQPQKLFQEKINGFMQRVRFCAR